MRTVLVILALAGAAAADARDLPDTIVMPHDLHHAMEVDCLACHEGVDESRSAADAFRPGMDTCAMCHDVEDDGMCVMCHTNVDMAGDYPGRAYGAPKFAHAPHVDAGLGCVRCHGDPAADARPLPGKPDCRACHATADFYADCRLCHADGADLRPAGHDAEWDVRHGAFARDDRASCFLCHTQATCQECHAGDGVRPRSHTLDFAFSHASRARGSELECAACHTEPEFCAACHAANRVLPRSHSRVGWVRLPDGGQHAVDGLFGIESCIACHAEGPTAPTCAACHGG